MKDISDVTEGSATRRESGARPLMPVGGAFITAFLIAMHETRERQAAREIRRHRHLAHAADAYEERRSAELKRDLLQNRADDIPRTARRHSPGLAPGLALAGRILIAAALIAIGLMHVIGGSIIRSALHPPSVVASQYTLGAD